MSEALHAKASDQVGRHKALWITCVLEFFSGSSPYYMDHCYLNSYLTLLLITLRAGTMPTEWMENFPRLKFLDVSFNKLSGSVPSASDGPFLIPESGTQRSLGTVALFPMSVGYGICGSIPSNVNVSIWATAQGSSFLSQATGYQACGERQSMLQKF